tara:strand:+ start:216 stop:1160 length:945 start_codon:yes stop_codon:yes gene_type:complete
LSFSTLLTGQHKSLFEDVASLIPTPDIQLDVMRDSQSPSDVMRRIMGEITKCFDNLKPRMVLVQGDTTTAAAVALSAFYHNLPVGHIEAGLRTHDLTAPFPEELNRQLISRVSKLNWAPTQMAMQNLENEGCKGIVFTGNTIVDACLKFNFPIKYTNKVLVTLHRRENFGEAMKKLFLQIEELAENNTHLEFIFPMHPNPEVIKHCGLLKTVSVIDPLPYQELLKLLSEVRFVISDSGGIQEECATFKKKIIVCRSSTERPEGVEAGFAMTVGTNIKSAFSWANDLPEWKGQNPYGDGKASERIISSIKNFLEL